MITGVPIALQLKRKRSVSIGTWMQPWLAYVAPYSEPGPQQQGCQDASWRPSPVFVNQTTFSTVVSGYQ
jgi:hypothetical protein